MSSAEQQERVLMGSAATMTMYSGDRAIMCCCSYAMYVEYGSALHTTNIFVVTVLYYL